MGICVAIMEADAVVSCCPKCRFSKRVHQRNVKRFSVGRCSCLGRQPGQGLEGFLGRSRVKSKNNKKQQLGHTDQVRAYMPTSSEHLRRARTACLVGLDALGLTRVLGPMRYVLANPCCSYIGGGSLSHICSSRHVSSI